MTRSTFGLSQASWDHATEELREAILRAARERRMTSYSEVAAQITVTHVEAHSALLNHLLGAVVEQEAAARRPLLTAIVTHRDGDMEPGRGFYDAARSLGYPVTVPFEFWADQVQQVFTLHGRPRERARRTA